MEQASVIEDQAAAHGVASGEVFILAYPHPFLEYYWYANRSELDASVRLKLFPTLEHAVVAGDTGAAET